MNNLTDSMAHLSFCEFVSWSETNRFKFVKFRVQKKAFLL